MQNSINTAEVQSLVFNLSIGPEEYLKYYSGQVKWVLATSSQGLKVRFPANLLSPHITHNGINGQFILKYLTSGKAISLNKTV